MKKKMGILISIFAIILSLNFISASVTVGNPSHVIDLSYGLGDVISGWVNISLNNEPTSSILKSSFGENINLIDLIKKVSNSGFVKSCNPVGCVSGYVTSNEATSKTSLNLSENESILIGFNISGNAVDLLTSISGFTFNLTSNNSETGKFPLAIDILNDGENEWMAYVPSDNFGSENKGCFGVSTRLAKIAEIFYCERIRLSKTPEVELGAYVKGNTPDINFFMNIKNVDGSESEGCMTNAAAGTGIIERVSCSVPSFSITKDGDYFVCIQTINSIDANKYEISAEEDSNKCGFSSETGSYEGHYNYDFEIFARPKLYAGNINFILNDDELINARSPMTADSIEEYIENYTNDTYKNNCSMGCIIPVKIFSGVDQQINLSNTYVTDPYIISYVAGISTTTDKFYDVAETPALINSGFQKLYLGEAGFRVPLQNGNPTFSLTLGEQLLFSEQLSVGEISGIKSLTPNITGIKCPTKFTVIFDSSLNITKYSWNFGDGQIQNTTKREVTHTYNTVGKYTLKISLFDLAGTLVSSREFNIDVVPASQIVPMLLVEAEMGISQIKMQIQNNFSQFEQKAVNYSLKLGQIESNITRLKTSASQASSETQFEAILGELLGMKIPQTIKKTAYSEGISFYPEGNNINLNILKQIGGGNYETNKEEQYKTSILDWETAKINTELIYSEISAIYPDYQEPFLKTFDVKTTKSGNESAYIIIKDMVNILFKENYSQKKEGGYYYINFDNPEERIVFSTTENIDFINLPMFISPPISQLGLVEWAPFTEEGQLKKWVVFSIIAILIFLTALVVWKILKIWYKRKYESYLFKNRNNLYNLVTYIENEKKKGTSEGDMADKLRKAGWNSEQVRYALRKYSGKRTGMPEIPIGMIKIRRFFKEKKKSK